MLKEEKNTETHWLEQREHAAMNEKNNMQEGRSKKYREECKPPSKKAVMNRSHPRGNANDK